MLGRQGRSQAGRRGVPLLPAAARHLPQQGRRRPPPSPPPPPRRSGHLPDPVRQSAVLSTVKLARAHQSTLALCRALAPARHRSAADPPTDTHRGFVRSAPAGGGVGAELSGAECGPELMAGWLLGAERKLEKWPESGSFTTQENSEMWKLDFRPQCD